MDDNKIIGMYFDRCECAIDETQKKYGTLCLKIANNILNNEQDAEECINDVYLDVWNTIPPTKPNNFKAFICKITRNHSLRKFEYNTAQKRNSNYIISLEEIENTLIYENPSNYLNDKELGAFINDFLKEQKKLTRAIFIRRYFFFDKIKDISVHFAISESKVKSILLRTRNKLYDYLLERGIEI